MRVIDIEPILEDYDAGLIFNHELPEVLRAAPIVEADPVKPGKWVPIKVRGVDTIFACSECSREIEVCNDYSGKPSEHVAKKYPYCHCGAKMSGNADNGAPRQNKEV